MRKFVVPCEPNALASDVASGFAPGARSSGNLLMPDAVRTAHRRDRSFSRLPRG